MTHIAVIALAPGQCGFHDSISGIRLSLAEKEAKVTAGMNTTGLVEAVKAGKITVVSGSLGSETFMHKEATEAIPAYYRIMAAQARWHNIKPSVESIMEQPMTKELEQEETKVKVEVEVVEEQTATEEPVEKTEEVTPKKKTTRKKKAEPVEEVKED